MPCSDCLDMKPEPRDKGFGKYPLTCKIHNIGVNHESYCDKYRPTKQTEQIKLENPASDRESNRFE